jgi:hypothetical protein
VLIGEVPNNFINVVLFIKLLHSSN